MRIFFAVLVAAVAASCSPKFNVVVQQKIINTETKLKEHTGFYLYDLELNQPVVQHNADRYFTPASNTKILSFYTGLTILGDSIPALRYVIQGDSMIFWGMGDATFLYKHAYDNQRTVQFLSGTEKSLYYSPANFYAHRFGEGWAWDDYTGSYQSELGPFPIYGNLLSAKYESNELWVEPARLAKHVTVGTPGDKAKLERKERENTFVYGPSYSSNQQEFDVPFIVSDSLTVQLLEDTLLRAVQLINEPFRIESMTYYSTPADSLYKVMMQESDNFLAEQLLLTCSAIISDSLSTEPAIRFMQRNHFADLPDPLRWVDGSGLSRYNLFTPQSIAHVWKKIYAKVPRERLFSLLATGGVNGTVKNWYKSASPYVFGKTGTLANNHNLSGYLLTRSGKTLIFVFMNNNFIVPTTEVRKNMQEILEYIRDNY